MNKFILSILTFLTLSTFTFGQSPEGFKYQAVVRDANSTIINNQSVGVQLTIQQGSIGGASVYIEFFSPTTNGYGLVNLEIGTGTTSDDFSTIDWANGPYFIETAIDVTGGTSYVVMGTSQLMSVPYALHAKTADNVINDAVNDADADAMNEIQDLELTGNILTITNNGTATSIDLSAYLDNTDTQLNETQVDAFVANNGYLATEVDGSITNEIQDLDLTGNILTITNNGTATSIDLSAYLDNTDTQLTETQVDAFVANNGYLNTEVDGSITNEIQTINRTGTTVTLSNGGGSFQDSVNVYTAGDGIDITNNVVSNASCAYTLGQYVPTLGGFVFYLNESGCHGLVAGASDLGLFEMGGASIYARCFGDWIYSGELNTSTYINVAGIGNAPAAEVCQNSSAMGFTDWYLPSILELRMMHFNLHIQGVGGFIVGTYNSSTEPYSNATESITFPGGTQGVALKTSPLNVRAVRSF